MCEFLPRITMGGLDQLKLLVINPPLVLLLLQLFDVK